MLSSNLKTVSRLTRPLMTSQVSLKNIGKIGQKGYKENSVLAGITKVEKLLYIAKS